MKKTINYTNESGAVRIAELRHYDPVMGLMKIVDPFDDTVHEMIYNRTTKKWFVQLKQTLHDWNMEEPVIKQIDTQEGDVPVTIKRFPSNPLD